MSITIPNPIKAISTVYRGYRFRSRLEARWALFFDLAGVKWSYEVEPLDVSGTAYLPDFTLHLPSGPIYHEVKPDSLRDTLIVPMVYLAGKMSVEHEWRGDAAATSRTERLGVSYDDLHQSPQTAWSRNARDVTLDGTPFVLVGPFPSGCDHGCGHSPGSLHMAETCDGAFDQTRVLAAALGAIRSCNIFCAHIGTADAFGALVEIGYAAALGRSVFVTVEASVAETLARKDFRIGGHGVEVAASFRHDLWFACAAASASRVVKDAAEARRFHAKQIEALASREYRLVASIAASGHGVAMSFGDPLSSVEDFTPMVWGGGKDLGRILLKNRDAALAARAHRFDGR